MRPCADGSSPSTLAFPDTGLRSWERSPFCVSRSPLGCGSGGRGSLRVYDGSPFQLTASVRLERMRGTKDLLTGPERDNCWN